MRDNSSFARQRNEISIKTAQKDWRSADFGIKIAIISEKVCIFAAGKLTNEYV